MPQGNTLEKLPIGDDKQRAALIATHQSLGNIILGKDPEISLALACLLARGHLLIEDLPGLGKTILAQSLARVLGLSFQRIQFTSDLLPADIIGVSIFRQETGQFEFQRGPVFAELVLADEVNRATPKAQSALLEAMEERQVSVDGTTHALPSPYFVVATQNPSDQIGTFPLPESQLDRFLMRVELGYPNEASERELLVVRYRPPPKDDAARLYEKFTAATGITPNLGETPLAYSGRLGANAASGAATEITQLYLQARYGATDIGDVSALRAAVNEYSRAARA
jgi:MoxR-like ATPase